MFNNIVGSVLWSFSMIFAGHYLSALFMEKFGIDLKKHIEYIVIGIVLVTTLPVLFKLLKKRVHL
jgi:membrane-associated protein